MFPCCLQFAQVNINQILYAICTYYKIHKDFDLRIGLLIDIELNLIQEIAQSQHIFLHISVIFRENQVAG
jgi:hypothetical protein